MLATGGSSIMAADRLKAHGARDILFACLVASPEGVRAVQDAHDDIPIITAAVDRELDDDRLLGWDVCRRKAPNDDQLEIALNQNP